MTCDLVTRLSASANPCGRFVGFPTMRRERFTVVCCGSVCRPACMSNANAQPGELGAARGQVREECTCNVAVVKYDGAQSECNAQQSNLRVGGSARTRSPPAFQDSHSVRYMADERT